MGTSNRYVDQTSPNPDQDDTNLGVDVVLTLGAIMLGAGSSTDDIERAMRLTGAAIGVEQPTAVVTFNTISLSYSPGPAIPPVTAIQLVLERSDDYRRLLAAARLMRDLRSGSISLRGARAEIEHIRGSGIMAFKPLTSIAQAVSAAALTLVIGGTVIDVVATLLISAIIQPFVVLLDKSGLPPFFRSLIGPLLSVLLVVATVAIDASINPALVLAGSLLQFLPGAALVAGMRDLIDQSIISGSARLAEAFLLGAAVASGTALGIAFGTHFDVPLEVRISVTESWHLPIKVIAAGIACGAWAFCLGERWITLLSSAALGAIGWFVFISATQLGIGKVEATTLAGLTIGVGGHLLAGGTAAPIILWVVPATYPLLPGLLIVNGMLSADAINGLVQLSMAAATALALGAAVAFGNTLIQTVIRTNSDQEV